MTEDEELACEKIVEAVSHIKDDKKAFECLAHGLTTFYAMYFNENKKQFIDYMDVCYDFTMNYRKNH